MKILKQSTATTLLLGPFLDSTDGFTSETALAISQADVLLWKEGGTTLAQKNDATSATHRSNGLYTCPINATDTNTLGILTVSVSESGALPVRHDYNVVPANVYDSFILGTDTLDVQVTGLGSNVITAASIATGAIDADALAADTITATKIAADAITAAKIADGAIDANTFAAGAITGAAIATDAIDGDALSTAALTDIQGAVQAAIEANHLDHLLAADYNPASKPGVATALLNEIIGDDGGVSRFTANALELAPAGGGGGGTDLFVLRDNTAQGGSTTTIQLDAGALATNDIYKYNQIFLDGGTGMHQSRQIIGYDGATKTATIFPDWEVTPDATSEFVISPLGFDAATVENIADAVWDKPVAENQIAGSRGESLPVDVIRISGDATAADNLEAMVDGTGLTLTNVLLPWNPAWLGAELTNIPFNAAWTADIAAAVVTGLGDYDAPDEAYIDSRTLLAAEYPSGATQAAIEADTQDIQSRLPATLDSGRMRCKIEQITDVVLTQGGTGGQSIGGA